MRGIKYKERYKVVSMIFILIVVVYILRFFSLQIVEDKYKKGAASNAFLNKTVYPPRGMIYDRNGLLLVYNKPAYDITFIHREIQNLDTVTFCRDLKITRTEFEEKMALIKNRRKNPGYSSLTPQLFMSQIEGKDIAVIQQALYRYRGFYIQARSLRQYTYNAGAHVLGSIGEVSNRDIKKDDYYQRGDYSGRDGLEYTYEKDLRGEKGVEVFLRDARGRIKGRYEDGRKDISAKAGKNLKTTLDIQLQMIGEELLRGKLGSIVAIEPKTGEILAMVSNPTYNPSILVGKSRSKGYGVLLKDPLKPLLNRATQAEYSPGSTFKTYQAAVALQLGAIVPNSHFFCNGYDSQPIRCTHYHGSSISLYDAIEQSCNPYFWSTFKRVLEKNGYGEKNENFKKNYNNWRKLIMRFGFGQRFKESDIFHQNDGNIPTTKFYDRHYGKRHWKALTVRSLAIGQGEILVTPLQLANATCVIANRGYYITPHLNKADSMLQNKNSVGVEERYFDEVDKGMWQVNKYGTGSAYAVPNMESCGKTGTVDNSRGKPHSLYIGYAPRENPKIAIAVVVENAGFGSLWAAPIANFMMEYYLKGEFTNPEVVQSFSKRRTNGKVKRY